MGRQVSMRAFTVGLILAQLALVACVMEPTEVSTLADDAMGSPLEMLEDAEQGLVGLLEEAESETSLDDDDDDEDDEAMMMEFAGRGGSAARRAPAKKVGQKV